MSKSKRRCPCGSKNISQSCNQCSRYKLVFLLRSNTHKILNASGEMVSPVRWSFMKNEKKPWPEVLKIMMQRLPKDPKTMVLFQDSRYIQFWERNGSSPLKTIKQLA